MAQAYGRNTCPWDGYNVWGDAIWPRTISYMRSFLRRSRVVDTDNNESK